MAFLWGTTELTVVPESYNPPHAVRKRTVIDLIPYDEITNPSSILQDGGRERKQVSLSGFVTSLADYETLYADYLASTVRTFTGPDEETMSCMIWDLSPAKRIYYGKLDYSLILMEV